MTYESDPALITEVASAEQALRGALLELADRLSAGRRGRATDELVQHCREIAEILVRAVAQLGAGIAEEVTRAASAHMLARLVELERDLMRSALH